MSDITREHCIKSLYILNTSYLAFFFFLAGGGWISQVNGKFLIASLWHHSINTKSTPTIQLYYVFYFTVDIPVVTQI